MDIFLNHLEYMSVNKKQKVPHGIWLGNFVVSVIVTLVILYALLYSLDRPSFNYCRSFINVL